MRDEQIKRLQNEATVEKKVTLTQDYNTKRGPSHGFGNWTRRNDDNGAMMSTPTTKMICQTQLPITVKRSTTQKGTYSGQFVPTIGFAKLTFS